MAVADEDDLLPGTFVGRDAEVVAALQTLAQPGRLLTLTGPPGVGKTRLAVEVGERTSADYPDGVVFVDLASARDADTALSEVARQTGADLVPAIGVRRIVADRLHDRHTLLILDNAEQVAGLAEELPGLLDQAHGVAMLVTSRASLRLSIERTISVPPLAMPPAILPGTGPVDLDTLRTVPAVRMFAAEARAAQIDFRIDADNAAAVSEICIRVDGLPLAIKLAAVRVRMLTPDDIATRLKEHRELLESSQRDIPARHRTLHHAIAWSYDLLEPHEQSVFRQLSVFNSPWTLDAAQQVISPPDDLLTVVGSLLDKSLVQRHAASGATTRFTMLESLREYAARQLIEHGERQTVSGRHLACFVDLAARSEAVIGTANEARWWDPMALLERDVLAALDWADHTGDADATAALASALGWFRYLRGQVGTGSETVEAALQVAQSSDVPDPRLIPLEVIGGILGWARAELDRAQELLEAGLDRSVRIGDRRHEAIATAFLGHVARDRGSLDDAKSAHERARMLFDELGNARGSAWASFDLARVEWQAGALDTAAELLRSALTRFRRIDYHWAAAWTAWALGSIRLEQGDPDNGVSLLIDAMEGFEKLADRRGVASCLESLAVHEAARGEHRDSLVLLSAAEALRTRLLAPLSGAEAAAVTRTEQAAADALGEYEYESVRDAGRTMPIAQVLDTARRVGTALRSAAARDAGPPAVLTAREREVARLVAEGCTNQQIGRSLGITARTVEVHMRNIMGKLGVRSRSEIAVWMVTRP